jgi:hypothetical protein
LAAQSAVRSLDLGDVTLTYVTDGAFGRAIQDQSGTPAWEPVTASMLRPPPRQVD